MSIYGNPVTVGGSGGSSGGNAYGGSTPPTSGIGSNGDYYFEMSTKEYGIQSPYINQANSIGGYKFKVVSSNISIIGVRVLLRADITGAIKLATSDGTLLASVSASYNDGDWREIMFDEPVTPEVDGIYMVMFDGSTGSMYYNRNPSTAPGIVYICGREGYFPGQDDSGYAYSCDIIVKYEDPYFVRAQYYKENGAWSEVT